MLSIDLFATQFERELREGAVDDLEYRRMNDLREKMEYLMQAYKQTNDPAAKAAIKKRYNEYKTEREGYLKIREQQVPSKQDPFAYVKPEPRGIGDIQDPKLKMAQLAQKSRKGALANVGAGIKAFIKGEPEPLGEQELGRRGIGMANMRSLQATVEQGLARTIFQFPNMKYVVGEDDTDKMADYYNGQDAAGRTNFVYNVLGDATRFIQICKELGIVADPVEPQQPELPGLSPQGQLPLAEKKKSEVDDIEAGDIKVAREIQKLRAQYPAAKSDVEAVARAEIDSTERSQQQLAAIRGANEKQDVLLKQLVALDQEQGREINNLDKENNSLEKQLAQVQNTNNKLAQTVGQMTGTKKSGRSQQQKTAAQPVTTVVDLIPGAPADQQQPTRVAKSAVGPSPTTEPELEPLAEPVRKDNVVQLRRPDFPEKLVKAKKTVGSDITNEHGGGIGPKQHWQDLMQEGQPQELIHRYLAIDAENDVDAVRAAIQAISKDPALSVTSKSRLLGQIGMIIRRHRLPIGRAYYQFMRQYMEDISETALNPKDPKDDYEAKRRALHDLSLNKDVDQAAVLQRRLDLDREAKAKGLAETVTNVKAGMAEIYRRLAPKIERHRDSFLAGQLYDELENYAELHGAEGEFKRMMNGARNRAHMEYDTNPGGFQNWFWFLPFEDQDVTEMDKSQPSQERHGHRPLGAKGTAAKPVAARKVVKDLAMDLDQAFAKQKPVKKKGVAEGLIYSGDTWQDVLYRINVLNDIFGDQKDLAASFEPASQPEWGPFRDRILRSRTVLDTYAKVKQLANMNVPLTDVEIEMLADVAWDGGGGPVEPAGHWGERDYDWLEDLYAQQFAVVQHLLDQKAQGHGQNKTKSGQTVHEQGVAESNDDIKKRMSKLEALALAANRAGDDTKCKMYQQKIQSLKQKLSQSMAEGWSDQGNLTPYSVYIDGREWRAYKSDEHARAVAEKVRTNLKRQGRDQTVTIAPSKAKKIQESDEQLLEGIRDTASATAVIACLLTGGSLTGCATAPQQTSAQQVLKTGQDIGRTVQSAKKITRASAEAEVQQEIRNVLRGINRPEELNNSNILRIWKRIKGQPPVTPEPQAPEYGPAEPVRRPATEAKEIISKEDFIRERDRLLRMISMETDPANKQILRSAIRQLESRAENEGWISLQQRMIREDTAALAAEDAILKRIFVKHKNLMMEYGPDKITQAAEEVAYNVGDIAHITDEQITEWVGQVEYILGAKP